MKKYIGTNNPNPGREPEYTKYYFKGISKHEALTMWRCDVLTGELKRVKLEKEYKMDPSITTRNGGTRLTVYWVPSKKNWFYLSAKNIGDAKAKFEAQFNSIEAQLKAREEAKKKNAE